MTIAGSDPSGGAGMQADLLTLASMGCHPVSVITCITVQDSMGVEDVMPLDADWVVDQARCVLEDMPVAAFKIGLLGSVEICSGIAEILADYPEVPLIFDPTLSLGAGDTLANEELILAIRELIIPQSTLITPNSIEARRLAEDEFDEDADLAKVAAHLLEAGCEYVLITGTHENTSQIINTLYNKQGAVRTDSWQRLPGKFHGSGCTLSSAIAATLARGFDLQDAVREGQEYTWQTLNNAFRVGMGQAIPDRFFWARDDEDDEPDDNPSGN